MSQNDKSWDMLRVEQLRANMSANEIAALKAKGIANPASLTLDEVGVLFLVARDRIREIEHEAGSR